MAKVKTVKEIRSHLLFRRLFFFRVNHTEWGAYTPTDQGKMYDCLHEIAQPEIGSSENTTMRTQWSNKLRTGTPPLTNQPIHFTPPRYQLLLGCNASCVCVCSNSCAIWIWHYPSTPFIQIAVIFIPLLPTHSSRRAAFIRTLVFWF